MREIIKIVKVPKKSKRAKITKFSVKSIEVPKNDQMAITAKWALNVADAN